MADSADKQGNGRKLSRGAALIAIGGAFIALAASQDITAFHGAGALFIIAGAVRIRRDREECSDDQSPANEI